jgi:5'-phosphate synthase pdxT subunit
VAGSRPRVGVLALQGAFREHADRLRSLGADVVEVRTVEDLGGVDGIVLPGGESTTMGLLLESTGLDGALRKRIAIGLPVFGTCAGLILLATDLEDGRDGQITFGALDITARRNGYGRQVASFEGPVEMAGGGPTVPGVFIRAPRITRVGDGVEVLAAHAGEPVAVAQGPIMASAFHPELTDDDRLHERFMTAVAEGASSTT